MKKKLLIVFGTRPEAIKCLPLYHALKQEEEFEIRSCLTFQHRQLLPQAIDVFNHHPDFTLNVRADHDYSSLGMLTSEILSLLNPILEEYKPHLVFVQGDTTSTFTAALAAFYLKIPVAHLEAGLRTYDPYSPWPEEMNRQLTTRLATYHFAPTEHNKKTLLKEQVDPSHVFVTGNTGIDALESIIEKLKNPELQADVTEQIRQSGYRISERKMVIITMHRREHFGGKIEALLHGLKQLAQSEPEVDFVYPVHLNPNVFGPAHTILEHVPNFYLIQPLDYISMIYLMSKSFIVISDSGGIQEEAPHLAKPLLLTRDITERPEGVASGSTIMCGSDPKKMVEAATHLLNDHKFYCSLAKQHLIYGDGRSSQRIIELLHSKIKKCI